MNLKRKNIRNQQIPGTTRRIALEDLRVVPEWSRPLRPRHVESLILALPYLPPITVAADGRLLDGVHRLEAHRRAGATHVLADVVEDGTPDADLVLVAVSQNTSHGLKLTLAEAKQAAANLLAAGSDLGQNALAEVCGITSRQAGAAIRAHEASQLRPTEAKQQLDSAAPPPAPTPASPPAPAPAKRRGKDGRRRAVDPRQHRIKVERLVSENPGLSLRDLGRLADASPTTVAKVRAALHNPGPRGHFDEPAQQPSAATSRTQVTTRPPWWRRLLTMIVCMTGLTPRTRRCPTA